jgi:hypothetical protein
LDICEIGKRTNPYQDIPSFGHRHYKNAGISENEARRNGDMEFFLEKGGNSEENPADPSVQCRKLWELVSVISYTMSRGVDIRNCLQFIPLKLFIRQLMSLKLFPP